MAESPEYLAWRLWDPTDRAEVVRVCEAGVEPVTGCPPGVRLVAPSKRLTEPGLPNGSPEVPVTVEVMSTSCPNRMPEGSPGPAVGATVRAVALEARAMVRVRVEEAMEG